MRLREAYLFRHLLIIKKIPILKTTNCLNKNKSKNNVLAHDEIREKQLAFLAVPTSTQIVLI